MKTPPHRNPNLGAGVVLIGLGLAWLGHLLQLYNLDWPVIKRLWPMLMVLSGAFIIARIPGGGFLAVISMLAGGASEAARAVDEPFSNRGPGNRSPAQSSVIVPLDSTIRRMELELDFGAGRFEVGAKPMTGSLLSVTLPAQDYPYTNSATVANGVCEAQLTMPSGEEDIKLSSRPAFVHVAPGLQLSINLDAGAAAIRVDARQLMLNRLEVGGGVISVKCLIGRLQDTVDVEVDAELGKVALEVPENATVLLADGDEVEETLEASDSTNGQVHGGFYRYIGNQRGRPLIRIRQSSETLDVDIDRR